MGTGYGASDVPSSEEACYRDIRAVLHHAECELHWPRSQIVLVGQSLGTGVTIELLASGQAHGIAGVVLVHPYRSIVTTRVKSRWLANCIYLLGIDMFCSDRRVAEVSSLDRRVLVLHGNQDSVVPYGHGKWLADQLSLRGQLFKFATLDGGSHGEVFSTHRDEIRSEVGGFLRMLRS